MVWHMVLQTFLPKWIKIHISQKVQGEASVFREKHTNAWHDSSRTSDPVWVTCQYVITAMVFFPWVHMLSFCSGRMYFAGMISHVPESHLPLGTALMCNASRAPLPPMSKPSPRQQQISGVRRVTKEGQDVLGTWAKSKTSDLPGFAITSQADLAQVQTSSCSGHRAQTLLQHTSPWGICVTTHLLFCPAQTHSWNTPKVSQLTSAYAAGVKYTLKKLNMNAYVSWFLLEGQCLWRRLQSVVIIFTK